MQFQATHYKRDSNNLVRVQWRAISVARELEHLICNEKLRELAMVCLEKKRLMGNLIAVFHYLKGVIEKMEFFRGAQLKGKSQQFQVSNKGSSNWT